MTEQRITEATDGQKPVSVIILAAGKGTRMNNPNKPKVLFELHDKPMIEYVMHQALSLHPAHIVTIIGFQREAVQHFLDERFPAEKYPLHYAVQDPQLGTGHAADQAAPILQHFYGNVIILSGDVPLLKAETLSAFARAHTESHADLTVLSVEAPNPTGYGRIVRLHDGTFIKIVEHKDATDIERQITEINSGIYIVDAEKLFASLKKVSNNNAQGEYYLTTIVEILLAEGNTVHAWKTDAFHEVLGINTTEQLSEAESMLASA
jgi:UDP-N-acetylglucosamine diphosphorylase/glucosamine-1-phosphate N-acetyltransferase